MIPDNETWEWREVVSADLMNRRTNGMYQWMYDSRPSCRLTAMQVGSDPTKPTPPGTRGQGWIGAKSWASVAYYGPGTGVDPENEWDNTGGQMLTYYENEYVWRIVAPEDGLYRVEAGCSLQSQTATDWLSFRLAKNVGDNNGYENTGLITELLPGKLSETQRIGTLSADVPMAQGDYVGIGTWCSKQLITSPLNIPGSFISVEWIGRLP